jgi:radical SAM superfamily enzyme YgiQ (UPF0313 family)
MNILFVSPINRTYVIMPMLGLGYLASIARKGSHQITMLDCKNSRFTFKDFEEYIKERDFDLVCFQVFTYDINSVKQHIAIVRKYNKDAVIVAGGAHPSGDPAGTMEYLKGLDFAFKGESEIGFEKFLNELERQGVENFKSNVDVLRGIPGLIYRAEGSINMNPPVFIEKLDELEFPAWDLMDPRTYPESPHGAFAKNFPTAPIIITRGCPHQCTFCAGKSITGNKIRKRSIDNVLNEIYFLSDKFGVKEILIEDENFTLHKDMLIEFCTKLAKNKRKISWSFPSGIRIETLSKEILRLMEDTGCYSMAIGIEFGSQRIHDLTKKRLSIELIKDRMALLSESKIKTTGFFLMGIPGETRQDMLSTIDLAMKLNIDRAQFNNFMPLPGSQLWDQLLEENKLSGLDWDNFFVHDVAYIPEGMTKKEMKRLQRKAYLKFYMRPKVIIRILKEIRSFTHLKMLLNRFMDALR